MRQNITKATLGNTHRNNNMDSKEIRSAIEQLLDHLIHLKELIKFEVAAEMNKYSSTCKDAVNLVGEIDDSFKEK